MYQFEDQSARSRYFLNQIYNGLKNKEKGTIIL